MWKSMSPARDHIWRGIQRKKKDIKRYTKIRSIAAQDKTKQLTTA